MNYGIFPITNDAILWATETMGNARCRLELFLRVVTVSMGIGVGPVSS